jgi:hypothetical protein
MIVMKDIMNMIKDTEEKDSPIIGDFVRGSYFLLYYFLFIQKCMYSYISLYFKTLE